MVCPAWVLIWKKKPNLVDISIFYDYGAMSMPGGLTGGWPIKT